MARSSAASLEAKPDTLISITWSAAYQDVGGYGDGFLDPNEIGLDPLPDCVRDQFDALAAAARAIIGAKAMGMDMTFNITLEGSASPGHQDTSEYCKVTVAKGPNSLNPSVESELREVDYPVTANVDTSGPGAVQ